MRSWKERKLAMGFRAYAALSWSARVPPERIARRGFRWGARIAHATFTTARATVTRNYAQVLGLPPTSPQVRTAVRDGFIRYGRFWFEAFRMIDEPDEHFSSRMVVDGLQHLDAALASGKGAVVVMPHAGSWDAAGHMLALRSYPILGVVEALKPKELLDLFLAHRAALGVRTIPLERGGGVGEQLREHLEGDGVVCLVADRDLSGRGVDVEMFGAVRKMPAGPAVLSLSTGAPLLPACTRQTPGGWHAEIFPAISIAETGDHRKDVASLTAVLSERFEEIIAADPTDWHMFQPAWP